MTPNTTFIPVAPGYYVLSEIGDDNDFPAEIHRDPVVAWALESELRIPYAITLSGVKEDAVIERPDGQVDMPGGAWYSSASCWLHEQQDDYAEKHQINSTMLAALRRAAEAEISKRTQDQQEAR